jgi:eukaryotic-like serine/threonine-protein kinase
MALTVGTRLGSYEIISLLGAGGMGEVYRARDPRVGRDVAIKISTEQFSDRFEREIRAVASLNHSNICVLHDVGPNYLVMELVEGATLAERIKQGAIPLEESLEIARQIADALEAAHEKGIVHRDLKPANIKIKPDGTVKVLDFGLAKVGGTPAVSSDNSPTLSVAQTAAGVILGTAAYMSPEQAKGKAVDKRADIWAFGVVLYEMLTGRVAFQGEDVSEILASVIKGDVNLDLLPKNLPSRVRDVIGRCLQKDLKKRYRDIGDVQFELEQAGAHLAPEEPAAGAERPLKLRLAFRWMAAAIILTAIIAGVAVWILKPTPPLEPRQVTRLYFELPKDQQFSSLNERSLAVSPNGRQIVYATPSGLYSRSMDDLDAKLIPGTGGNPRQPFFSPDGAWIGYWSGSENQLKKIALSGGAPVTIMDGGSTGSFGWEADDTIVYGQQGKGILRISANGGTPELLVKAENETSIHPQILPDGKSLQFSRVNPQPFKVIVQSLKSGERKELLEGHTAKYLPTGHIVYVAGNNLLAVRFDLKTLKVLGGPVSLVEGVLRRGGAPQYDVSDSGTLAYMPSSADVRAQRTLVWVDRNGKEEPLGAPPNLYIAPRISPEGMRIVMGCFYAGGGIDICTWDAARKVLARLTFDPAEDDFPLWTPDGKRIAFAAFRAGNVGIYVKAADGTGNEELIRPTKTSNGFPGSWSGDGKTLLLQEIGGENQMSPNFYIGSLSMEGDRIFKPLLQGKYMDVQPKLSTNGRWLAYTSNESGRNEIYVRPYPDVNSGKWQVSTSGGDSPLWSRDGRELFYRNGDEIMAVPVKTDPAFSCEGPKVLFRGTYVAANFTLGTLEVNPWDISPDGKRFLMMKESASNASAGEGPRRINIVLNWLEELKQRVPVK